MKIIAYALAILALAAGGAYAGMKIYVKGHNDGSMQQFRADSRSMLLHCQHGIPVMIKGVRYACRKEISL